MGARSTPTRGIPKNDGRGAKVYGSEAKQAPFSGIRISTSWRDLSFPNDLEILLAQLVHEALRSGSFDGSNSFISFLPAS
jgi:hypothetical protein